MRSVISLPQSCEVSHRERVPARSASGQVFYTAHFYMLAQKVYTMRRDLRYNFQERQDTKVEALPTITRPDDLWPELLDLKLVMSSKHSPHGLSGYSSKFLSPLHSGVPHVKIGVAPGLKGGHVDGHTGACDWPTRHLEAMLLSRQMDQHQGAQGKGMFWMKILV